MSLTSMLKTAACSSASFLLPYLVPAADGQVVLTSFHGRGYRGNPRVLFEALVGHPELEPIWLATEPAIVQRLQREHGEHRAALAHSFRGVWALARARAIVISHGITDLPWLHLSRRAVTLQSFHGLPTKRGEYLGPRPSPWQRFNLWRRHAPIDAFLSSSDLVSRIYGARFGLPPWKLLELGYPAYDRLAAAAPADPATTPLPHAPAHDRLILYAPTFRKREGTRLFPFDDLDGPRLHAFLEEERAVIALRLHPNEPQDLGPVLALSPRIVAADHHQVEDVNTLIRRADVIVTDYSSIYLEGLLRDVPAVFVPYDRHVYERGIAFDYDALTPGPKVASQADFLDACRRGLHQPEADRARREMVKALFFAHPEGGATARVIAFLEEKTLRRRAPAVSSPARHACGSSACRCAKPEPATKVEPEPAAGPEPDRPGTTRPRGVAHA